MKILLVDDIAQNLYMLDILFSTNGFEVEQAVNGKEALEKAQENPPDIIISDILMPVMDGFNLCRIWKNDKDLKSIPFIFYTATYTDPKDEEFALSLGAERFVIKPKEPEELLSIVQDVLVTQAKEGIRESMEPEPEMDQFYKDYNETLIRKLENKMIQQEALNKRLAAFYRVSCALVSMKPSNDLIRSILNEIVQAVGYQKVIYFEVLENNLGLKIKDAVGLSEETASQFLDALNQKLSSPESLARIAAAKEQIINIPDTSKDPRWVALDVNVHSAIFIPTKTENQVLGVLALYSTELDSFSADEQQIVALANSLAISISNKKKNEEMAALNNFLEERIAKRTSQLEISNKDLEAFEYSISHDLRAPLRAIDGYTKVLQDECKDKIDDRSAKLFRLVCDNITRMDRLITDVLSLSRVGIIETRTTEVDMEKMVREIIHNYELSNELGKVKIQIEPLPKVEADPTLIRQVWQNLISNAIKFTRTAEAPKITISAERNCSKTIFSITDNGIGFDPKNAQDIFKPFNQSLESNDAQGSGVGLAIVKRIVDRHGGEVWCDGKVGEGATFSFSIPI